MADALCGPSNALQNFQKHTSVDRTLQQDRLVGRHSPSQGFRSSPGSTTGALDPEFEAFQAGNTGLPQTDFQRFPPQFVSHPPPPQFAPAPQGLDWASDFQRLNLSSSNIPPSQQHRAPGPSTASWHQDFMQQQAPSVQAPTYPQNSFGGLPGYAMGGYVRPGLQASGLVMNGNQMSEVAQGKQRAQEAMPEFDEAAFERAFAEAHQDMLNEAEAEPGKMDVDERVLRGQAERIQAAERELEAKEQTSTLTETDDPALVRIREQRPAVYATLKIRSAIDLGNSSDALPYLTVLETMESTNSLVEDAGEAKWVVDALQRLIDREGSQDIKIRAERIVRAVNERLMSTYPLSASRMPLNQSKIWEELEAAGYTRTPVPEQAGLQQEQQKEEQPLQHDDEMAETAGRLLERVADNTSDKFQNSQFLELMRRLRDREVRVEGDKMVEVSAQPSTSTPSQQEKQPPTASTIPEVDPNILNHAATDFSMPVFSEEAQEYALSRQSTNEPVTDEISDQFSYYNVHAAYHR